jgi:hypothetical protein
MVGTQRDLEANTRRYVSHESPHDADHYAAVRDQEEPLLFHLDRARTKGLSRKGEHRDQAGNEFDYAVMLNALVRLHETALVGVPGGQLNSNEYRVLCQRLIEMLGLDTSEP